MTSRYPASARLISIVTLIATLLLTACGGTDGRGASIATETPQLETLVTSDDPVGSDAAASPTSAPATAAATPATPTATAMSPPTSTPDEPVATAVVEESDPVMSLDEFHETLDALLSGVDGTVAVSLLAADGTVLYELNSYEAMEAASLYKLPVMVEVFRQRDEGLLSFDDEIQLAEMYFAEGADSFSLDDVGASVSIDTLVFAMIAQSSNVAAYALLDLVGSESVNATMNDLGLSGIEIRWSPQYQAPLDEAPEEVDGGDEPETEGGNESDEEIPEEPADEETETPSGAAPPQAGWLSVSRHTVTATVRGDASFNVVTAADVARLLLLMVDGDLGNDETSGEMLDLLAQQQIYGGLPALLPEGSVAHKTGYLEDGIVNDAGVVYTPNGQFVAVVLTEDVREDVAFYLTSQIGLLLYELGS